MIKRKVMNVDYLLLYLCLFTIHHQNLCTGSSYEIGYVSFQVYNGICQHSKLIFLNSFFFFCSARFSRLLTTKLLLHSNALLLKLKREKGFGMPSRCCSPPLHHPTPSPSYCKRLGPAVVWHPSCGSRLALFLLHPLSRLHFCWLEILLLHCIVSLALADFIASNLARKRLDRSLPAHTIVNEPLASLRSFLRFSASLHPFNVSITATPSTWLSPSSFHLPASTSTSFARCFRPSSRPVPSLRHRHLCLDRLSIITATLLSTTLLLLQNQTTSRQTTFFIDFEA